MYMLYLPAHLTCTWHECIYSFFLCDNTGTYVYDFDEVRICLLILLYVYYMQCTCICKIKCVLCSEVRNCLLTLLYISCTWVMILTCWCLKQFIPIHLFIVHEFCCDYNIIVCCVKSDIHVLVLICPYLVLDSVLYILFYIVFVLFL